MQSNEFEKNIQATMESFSIKPNDAVWNLVAKQIAKKEKRRRAFFWLFSTAILCGALGLWILSIENRKIGIVNQKSLIAGNANKMQSENKEINKEKIKHNATTDTSPNKSNLWGSSENEKVPITSHYHSVIGNKSTKIDFKIQHILKLKSVPNSNINDDQQISKSSLTNNVESGEKVEKSYVEKSFEYKSKSKIAIESQLKNSEKFKTDSNNIAQEMAANNVADTIKVTNKNVIKSSSQKSKLSYGITVLAGISDNIKVNNANSNYANESLFIPPGLSVYDIGTSLNYFTSYSFGIGGFISKPLNKRFDISLGVYYHYYQVNSRVGNNVSRNANYFDSTLRQNTSINDYYSYGDVAWYKNNYHLLQFPFLISYKINKNVNKSIKLSGGIVPGYLFGSKALFDNKSSRIFYVNKDQFHRINLSMNAGILWSLKNKNGNAIEIGPMLQYQINNLVKPFVSNQQHLFFAGIITQFIIK